MLSAAKHLFFLIENKQKQILRFAQDDTAGGFFRRLLGCENSLSSHLSRIRKEIRNAVSEARRWNGTSEQCGNSDGRAFDTSV
jgi:hypothetical protein